MVGSLVLAQEPVADFEAATKKYVDNNGGGGAGSEVIISETAPDPTSLDEGTLWWNSDSEDLNLYVLFDNGGQLIWVQTSANDEEDSGANVIIDDTPPLVSQDGDMWWDSSIGELFVKYEGQFVEASSGTARIVDGSGGDGASIHVSDIPPIFAQEGNLWWNTTDNTLYIYYLSLIHI